MAVTPTQIDLLRGASSEDQNLEFKEAKDAFSRDKLAEYCIAIANEGGGKLLLGISDKPPRAVVGSNAFPNVVETTNQLFQKVGFRVDVDEVTHPQGRVVVFSIPSRPRGSACHVGGKYLMRSGEALVPMSQDRLRTIFSEGAPDWLEEPGLNGLQGSDVVELLDTQTFFDLMKQPYPTSQVAVLERLVEQRLVDRVDGGFSIRRLGALLLAKRLDRFPDLSRKAPRVIVYTASSKLEVRLDQPGTMGYAVGFPGLVEFVLAQLPQNEILEKSLRTKVKLLSEHSLREVIANALIHQDLAINGAGPMIEVYPNRLEISNPGIPIVPVERFIDGYRSRNERLADVMRRMRICEERSSGIDRLVQEAEELQLPAPDFRAGHERTIVTVFGPRPFDEMDRDERIRACYQHCALKRVVTEWMTNQSLRERFGLPESKAAVTSQIIASTIEAGLIKPDETVGGSRKYARYVPFWA